MKVLMVLALVLGTFAAGTAHAGSKPGVGSGSNAQTHRATGGGGHHHHR